MNASRRIYFSKTLVYNIFFIEFILKDQDSLHELEGEHIYLNTKESTATHGN